MKQKIMKKITITKKYLIFIKFSVTVLALFIGLFNY